MLKQATPLRKTLVFIVLVKLLIMLLVLNHTNNNNNNTSSDNDDDTLRWRLANRFARLRLDTRPPPTARRIDELMDKELPALPLQQLRQYEGKQYRLNESCAPFAELLDIEFHNDYWQVARSGAKIYYLYGAYYDKRPTISSVPLVRLVTLINELNKQYPPMFCQLWFNNTQQPVIVPVAEYDVAWYSTWGSSARHFYPTIVTCKMPTNSTHTHQVPETVSLVAQQCDRATNNLRVFYELPVPKNEKVTEPIKKHFAVCVKSLDFPYEDISVRLIEWLELLRLLGADKVTIYEAQLHPNTTRVLRHYARTNGFVDLRAISLARGEPHSARHIQHFIMHKDHLNRVLNEIIPYNDCYYRHIYQYDYIAVFDIDEIIMPLGNLTNWPSLIDAAQHVTDPTHPNAKCNDWVSFCFRNVYYPRYPEKPPRYLELPSYFYMMQHVERVAKHLEPNLATKCIHSTKYAVTVFNHFPLKWKNACGPKSVPIEIAQMQHYREPDIKATLLNPIVDDNIWRFSEPLVQRTTARLKELGFLEQSEDAF